MRHHFGDFLDRDGGYWTIVSNRERYAYRIADVAAGSKEITIVTLGKADEHWKRALSLPNLEELTLHEPSREQLHAVAELHSVRRLRITHARPKTIEFIRSLSGVEELVLEYVSGFNDLAPLQGLTRLRALHLENLRGVVDFGGLAGISSLKYLAIHGTTDWKQPIADFEFLRGLPSLEVLALWEVVNKAPYPALLPALTLTNLRRLQLHRSYLAVEEYALLEEALQGVEGADFGPYEAVAQSRIELPRDDVRAHLPEDVLRSKHPEVMIQFDGKRTVEDPTSRWFEFTGKGARRVKCGSPSSAAKCREYAAAYAAMRETARQLIERHRTSA